ncbi:MAG TPA: hypothetical protein VI583_11160 [Cyclobacteriaceae bacterium]|nr:hypothetical protein [Cyclobacteriaceae bacterium]
MTDFLSFWDYLMTIEKIYWLVAIPSTLLLLIQLVITFIAGDLDSGGDISHDTADPGDQGFHIFTYKNVLGFFTIFSWTGLGFLKLGLGTFFSVISSILAGTIMMLLMAWIFLKISKMNVSGTMIIQNAIDKTAEVYLTVPEGRKGKGKVLISIQGSVHELDAITDDLKPIPTGAMVLVMEVIADETLVVTKINS